MGTKIIASRLCCATGIHTGLCHGAHPNRILDIINFAESESKRHDSSPKQATFPSQPLGTKFVNSLQKAAAAKDEGTSRDEDTSRFTTTKSESSGSEIAPIFSEQHANFESNKKSAFITFTDTRHMPYMGTIFAGQPCTQSLRDQRRWILSLPVRGSIYINDQTCRQIVEKRKSLFAAGITLVKVID